VFVVWKYGNRWRKASAKAAEKAATAPSKSAGEAAPAQNAGPLDTTMIAVLQIEDVIL
jgi:hypothetical protein